ncbi:MAG TPA: fimbria/pilus periplasmic chaperone [Thermoanaerobaculia bacterium]|nr:fimbria/pilus periplasmic chaperone [Thermoanaerobaculia bacterium]
MNRITLMALLFGLVFGPARFADAAAFRVNPIRVSFDAANTSALLTLTNESTEELRFQLTVSQWKQAPGTGEMQLTPTDDIRFFPTLLTLKAGEERKVRVASNVKQGPVEKTYRIFFEELPGLKTAAAPAGASVKIITKMGVPIFVAPENRKAQADIASAAVKGGKLAFDVRNSGNVHFVLLSARATGLDREGKILFDKQREGWYVLSGDTRTYELDLTGKECSNLATVRFEMQTDIGSKPEESLIKREFTPITSGGCK